MRSFLEEEGHQLVEAGTGPELLSALGSRPLDLVLLDVMLASESGFDLLADVRRTSNVPVILLTARMAESDRVLGLRLGADDYVVKPFSPAELAARVASVLRRYGQPQAVARAVMTFGDLSIDTSSREVALDGDMVEMTQKEFDLLAFLAASPRQVFSREQLLDQVWGSSSAWQDDGTVTEHVRRIRRKLEVPGRRRRWIRTIRGVGYRFDS